MPRSRTGGGGSGLRRNDRSVHPGNARRRCRSGLLSRPELPKGSCQETEVSSSLTEEGAWFMPFKKLVIVATVALLLVLAVLSVGATAAVPSVGDNVGLFDPATGIWHLRNSDGSPNVVLLRQPVGRSLHGGLGLRRHRHSRAVPQVRRLRLPPQLRTPRGPANTQLLLRRPQRHPDRRRLQRRRLRHAQPVSAVRAALLHRQQARA